MEPSHNQMVFTFDSIEPERRRDKLQLFSVSDRTGDYDIRDGIREKWGAVDENGESTSTCSNLSNQFILSDNQQDGICTTDDRWGAYDKMFSQCISSPLLFYRCCCTFPDKIKVADEYKSIWECWLKNKKTNNVVLLSEWKGTPHLGLESKYEKLEDLPKTFLDDIIELLNYLLSDQCVHPYDHTVAGTQA